MANKIEYEDEEDYVANKEAEYESILRAEYEKFVREKIYELVAQMPRKYIVTDDALNSRYIYITGNVVIDEKNYFIVVDNVVVVMPRCNICLTLPRVAKPAEPIEIQKKMYGLIKIYKNLLKNGYLYENYPQLEELVSLIKGYEEAVNNNEPEWFLLMIALNIIYTADLGINIFFFTYVHKVSTYTEECEVDQIQLGYLVIKPPKTLLNEAREQLEIPHDTISLGNELIDSIVLRLHSINSSAMTKFKFDTPLKSETIAEYMNLDKLKRFEKCSYKEKLKPLIRKIKSIITKYQKKNKLKEELMVLENDFANAFFAINKEYIECVRTGDISLIEGLALIQSKRYLDIFSQAC